jgi:Protein of unknown function (DUF2970)
MSVRPEDGGLREAVQRKGSFVQSFKAVAWSFFGVRKGKDHAEDVARLNPVHVIVAGLIAAAVFVVVLISLVRWVVASGAAL